ncbi:cytochrome P450 [Lactarius pseudohatsudake]|nr:cytochrome P450 [Lactarius pseudohatsudake]
MAPIVHVAVASFTILTLKILVKLISVSIRSPLSNLPGPPSSSWLKGHVDQLFHPQGWDFHMKTVAAFGTAVRLRGFMGEDVLYLTDPLGLRTILTAKEHGDIYDEPPMIIEDGVELVALTLPWSGAAHKKQRRVLNAVFSVQRMRMIMPILWDVTRRLEESLAKLSRGSCTEIDMLMWMSRAETSPPSEYMLASKQLIPLSFPLQGFMRFIPSIVRIGTPRFRGFLAKIAPHPNIRKLREIIYILYDTNKSIYQQRVHDIVQAEKIGGAENTGKDMVSVLIQQNRGVDAVYKLSDDELISQMGTLIYAGHNMTSVALSRILHVLSLNQERQKRLRLELMDARVQRRDISYDELMVLPYLDAVCKETLRLYPPVTQLHRVPCKDSYIPLARPVMGIDGETIDHIYIRAGTTVIVGVAAVNRDPAIWGADADQWVPERWLGTLAGDCRRCLSPRSIHAHDDFYGWWAIVHVSLRFFAGFKFAEMEIKIVLYVLLSRMKFEPSETPISVEHV